MNVGDTVYVLKGVNMHKYKVLKVNPKTIRCVVTINGDRKSKEIMLKFNEEGIIKEGVFQGMYTVWTSKRDDVVELMRKSLRMSEEYWNDIIYKAQQRKDEITRARLELDTSGKVKEYAYR